MFNNKKIELKTFKTPHFIRDLKKEISLRLLKEISNQELSNILGQRDDHIKWVLEVSRKNPDYVLTLELLENYQVQLEVKLENISRKKHLIEKYKSTNNIPEKNYFIHNYHPNLNLHYFKYIDTKEKAYLFGLLFADGSLYRNKQGNLVISIELNVKDCLVIKNYIKAIGFESNRVKYYKRLTKDEITTEIKIIRLFRVRFSNNLFGESMILNGFTIGKKSDIIRFPNLENRELKLAFLLGYFDGDGKQGTTRISSSSRLYIEDIKSIFKLDYKLEITTYKSKSGENKKSYKLHLGADLFNEMLDNYEASLPRKRIRFQSTEERRKIAIERFSGAKKFKYTKEELKDMVWKYPLKRIAEIHEERFGISITDDSISYWCTKMGIEKPPIGYFLRQEYKNKDK
jgi:hypothetical protein